METLLKTNRREFLKIAITSSGGLMLGFSWSTSSAMEVIDEAAFAAGDVNFNSYLSISPEDVITIFSPNPELGQNIKTSFPMIVAEELDADWTKVKVVQAALDTKKYERQLTGGSGAIPHSWERLRKAGATARQMLIEAAAKRWNISASSLSTENGKVIDKSGNRSLTYGELATESALIPVPTEIKLKYKKDFKIIGKPIKNVENDGLFTGKPLFGLDFYREGMLHAMIQRPASFGTKIKSVDNTAA